MEKQIAGQLVHTNEEGYLTDFNEWSKDIAYEIAQDEGITPLTEKHWELIDYIQEQFKAEIPLTIRKIGKSNVTNIKEFYALFPNGPLKKASKIAGIPKPASCI